MTTEQPTNGNVVDIGKRRSAEPVEPAFRHKQRPYNFCRHSNLEFDDQEHTVECVACHQKFGPFEALLHITREWTMLSRNLVALRSEVRVLQEDRDLLQKDVTNLRAQRRRLVKKGIGS